MFMERGAKSVNAAGGKEGVAQEYFQYLLRREAGQLAVADALDGQVVEIFVRQFERFGQGLHIDGVAVVLRGDLDAARACGLTLEHLA